MHDNLILSWLLNMTENNQYLFLFISRWYPCDVLQYALPLHVYFIFASQIPQTVIPLFIDSSPSYCFIKTEEFPHGRIEWTHGNKSLFFMPCLFVIVLLPHLWRSDFFAGFYKKRYRIGIVCGSMYRFVNRRWKYRGASMHRWIVTPLIATKAQGSWWSRRMPLVE